jgi:hypothetical protein
MLGLSEWIVTLINVTRDDRTVTVVRVIRDVRTVTVVR